MRFFEPRMEQVICTCVSAGAQKMPLKTPVVMNAGTLHENSGLTQRNGYYR